MSIKAIADFGKQSLPVFPPFPKNDLSQFTFSSIVGILRDKHGNVFACDTGNSRIVVFNQNFTQILLAITQGFKNKPLDLPIRIAEHRVKDWIYVTEVGSHCVTILKLNYDGQKYTIQDTAKFGKSGLKNGEFNCPNGITYGEENGNPVIIVADEFAGEDTYGRIQIFDENGFFIRKFDTVTDQTTGTGYKFVWPQGIDTDSTNRLYLTDPQYARILRSDFHGNGISFSTTKNPALIGTPAGKFNIPRGVKIIKDSNNVEKMYVADNGAGKMEIFSLEGDYAGTFITAYGTMDAASVPGTDNILITQAGYPRFASWNTITKNVDTATSTGQVRDQICTDNQGLQFSQFQFSVGIDKDNQDTFYVADYFIDKNRYFYPPNLNEADIRIHIWKNTPCWNVVKVANLYDSVHNPFSPYGIVEYENDTVKLQFVSDTVFNFIWVYEIVQNAAGEYSLNYKYMFGTGLKAPKGICLKADAQNPMLLHIYIADSSNNQIAEWMYDLNANTATAQTAHLSGNILSAPADVAVYNNTLFIADQFNNSVVVYDIATKYMERFGVAGYEDADMLLPCAVEYYDGKIFVVDVLSRAIKVYKKNNNQYKLVDIFPEKPANTGYYQYLTSKTGGMWFPGNIGIYRQKNNAMILIPDRTLNRVNVYKYK